jgi:alpha-glucosidase
VKADPFSITVTNRAGEILFESAQAKAAPEGDKLAAYAPLALTHNENLTNIGIMVGWDYYRGEDRPWKQSSKATAIAREGDSLVVTLATSDLDHPTATLRISPDGPGVRIKAKAEAKGTPAEPANRLSLAFRMHDDDHFFGFGERFVGSDFRGRKMINHVQDGGFGHGESAPPSDTEPSPGGEGQTNVPIPWFLSPRGFGVLLHTTYRSVFHLGEEASDAWRIESWENGFDATVFADPDPLALIEQLTAQTGRPPEIADWVLAPRRRGNPGSDEMAKLRAAKIPTSVIDTALHYFPNGVGKELEDRSKMRAITADIHKRGFKAVAYFCPFVSNGWHPVFDEAVAKGYLVKNPDGKAYEVLDVPYVAGMIDFTNPEAVTWYQGWMQQALDDGWDGWMYDFAEYVPLDAVMFNGMSGLEAHNLYPVLYQKAAYELLEKQRRKDYLIFVRSGYSGTGGLVPMLWAGDQNTDFSLSDGLPAALAGALNAGMSGLPLWGSDISGYHYLYNPPPDKEVYLRWTELGAFSTDMHDENEGNGNGPNSDRWQIWKDQESQDIYRKYASLKTRMIPYLRIAVEQARARGTPTMRHLVLHYPRDPKVYGLADEYMFGDSLLVAPVVARGQTSRTVYLPEPAYFDFWTGERVAGGKEIVASAPLDRVPVYAKPGAIIPMFAEDVESLFPAADGTVVSLADRKDVVEAIVFAGGSTSVTLEDGTKLEQSAPLSAFEPDVVMRGGVAIPAAATEVDLKNCDACVFRKPGVRELRIAVRAQGQATAETLTAGALSLRLAAPATKRFVLTVRY